MARRGALGGQSEAATEEINAAVRDELSRTVMLAMVAHAHVDSPRRTGGTAETVRCLRDVVADRSVRFCAKHSHVDFCLISIFLSGIEPNTYNRVQLLTHGY